MDAWWAPGKKVRICRSDYQPEAQTVTTRAGQTVYCEGQYGQLLAPARCGCGEHLLSCVPPELAASLEREQPLEAIRTIQWVIQHHRPYSEIVTMNATVRTSRARPTPPPMV